MTEDNKKAIYEELTLILDVLPKGKMVQEPDEKWIKTYSNDWIESNNHCLNKIITFIQQRALLYLPEKENKNSLPAQQLTKTRYWVKFLSGYYKDEGCSHPDFPSWILSDIKDRRLFLPHLTNDGHPKTDCVIAGLIDAFSEEELWIRVKKFFPDYEMQSIETKPPQWQPPKDTHPYSGIQPHCKP